MRYRLDTKRLSSNIIEDILLKRGIEKEYIYDYLNPIWDLLPTVDKLGANKLDKFYNLLQENKDKKIMILVDSDCDGITSSAIIGKFLYDCERECFDEHLEFHFHKTKNHGLMDCIDYIVENNFTFVIIPDAGSNDIEQLKILKDNNINFIVIDHHLIENEDENPFLDNIISCKLDNYPNPYLTGSGLAFRCVEYLYKRYGQDNKHLHLSDLATIGIVADMQPLTNLENRTIVKNGLERIENKFIQAFIKKQEYFIKGTPTPTNISFNIAPYFNAMARTGKIKEQRELLYCLITEKNIEETIKLLIRVKSRQARAQNTGLAFAKQKIENDNLDKNKILLVDVTKNDFPSSIKGLVANIIASEYKKPTCIVSQKNEMLSGSGRGFEQGGISNFKSELTQTNLVEYALGHENAFGVSFSQDNMYKIIDIFNEKFEQTVEYIQQIDYIFSIEDKKNIQDMNSIGHYSGLWGKDIEEPIIVIENILLSESNVNIYEKSKTIRIENNGIYFLMFKTSDDIIDMIQNSYGKKINIIGKININIWEGEEQLQVVIKDFEIVKTNCSMFDMF